MAFVATLPLCSVAALEFLQNSHPRTSLDRYEHGDAAAVLSGDGPPRDARAAGEPPTRSETALALAQQRQVAFLLITDPYREGGRTRAKALSAGLAEEQITMTAVTDSTIDEAREIARICKVKNWHRLILVTSGYHLWRASALVRYFATRERWNLQVVECAADSEKVFWSIRR